MRSFRGFSLIELMFTVALLAIVLGLAVPSFTTLIRNNRATTQANDLISSLQLARSEALKGGRPVSVCAADVSAASLACGSDWAAGWMVYLEGESPGSTSSSVFDPADASEIGEIRSSRVPSEDLSLSFDGAQSYVRFLRDGRVDPVNFPSAGSSAIAFDLTMDGCVGENARKISIGITGRVSSERVSCPN